MFICFVISDGFCVCVCFVYVFYVGEIIINISTSSVVKFSYVSCLSYLVYGRILNVQLYYLLLLFDLWSIYVGSKSF